MHALLATAWSMTAPTTWWSRSENAEDATSAEDQFAAALIQQQPQIARLVQRLLGWPHRTDVDDVVQEALGAAWAHRGKFRGEGSLSAWVARIAVHEARRFHRRRRLWGRLLGNTSKLEESPAPAHEPNAENETAALVKSSLAGLSHQDREVLVLHYLEGQSIVAIARTLGLRENTAHARASRARQRLRALLQPILRDELILRQEDQAVDPGASADSSIHPPEESRHG